MPEFLQTDGTVAASLAHLSESRPEYWSYDNASRALHAFDFFQYPAMMVPEMLHDLIATIAAADSKVKRVYDAFLGSGSVLTEAMMQGFDFTGTDVNPLALLIAKVKSGPFRPEFLGKKTDEFLERLPASVGTAIDIDFPGIDKWFSAKVIADLAALRHAIRQEKLLWCRRFLWICLAETVRLSSNSRTSTYKLHIRSTDDIKARADLSAIKVYNHVLKKNLQTYGTIARILGDQGLLHYGRYTGQICLELGDSRSTASDDRFDLLITSPPYGDNVTTVPYGQHSYLPLQWIDLHDIDASVDVDCLRTTHAIDARSLGGIRSRALKDVESLCRVSPHLDSCLEALATEPKDRASRVATFSRDLEAAILPIMKRLRPHAYMVWVVGNRRVGGREVPTAAILREFLEFHGAVQVTTMERVIPVKRMAKKNAISSTMSKERILVFRKTGTK